MKARLPHLYQLNEYTAPNYLMVHVDLELDLTHKPARSKARVMFQPNPKSQTPSVDITLDGENIALMAIKLNHSILEPHHYELTDNSLTVKNVPQNENFTIETTNLLGENTDLFGLYETDGVYLVKAETEGLRRVFYCIDRPDNLATYTITIIAMQEDYPVLLANGTLIAQNPLSDGRHTVTWSDTLPKPTYLVAVVAGKLQYSATQFTTRSNHKVSIEFYVPSEATAKCNFAKEVLQQAMDWDERVCNLECELEHHKVAGVDKYASGASEPTGLNLFNTENLYASAQIKTDLGLLRVLEVVAHEFFHYWTGNRVTIRDWFNLPFKEGLTTFRAAMFCEDLFGTDITRLVNGKNLDERAPRQSSYTAVRSLYTIAAYEKSADIFRMMMVITGKTLFYSALADFLRQNDGGAVTIEELLESLTATTGVDLNSFLPWFTESGIPQLHINDNYDSASKRYTLKISTSEAKNRPIPVLMGLLAKTGEELVRDKILLITEPEMEFHFEAIPHHPTPSLLRDFSAPVRIIYEISTDDLLLLMQYDTNLYNRCEAAQLLVKRLIYNYCVNKSIEFPQQFFAVYRTLLQSESIKPWILAELLTLVSEEELIASSDIPQFELLAEGRRYIQQKIAQELRDDWELLFNKLSSYSPTRTPQFAEFDINDAGHRRLKALYYSYAYITNFAEVKNNLMTQFKNTLGKNMNETISALALLGEMGCDEELNIFLDRFYDFWQNDTHAINYWFRVQASTHSNSVVTRVYGLLSHPAFDLLNPNKVYSLIGTFINNPYGFHNVSGEGYRLVAEVIISLDKLNPPLAANLTQKFIFWEKYDEQRQEMLVDTLIYIDSHSVSVDVKNTTKKGLSKRA